MLCLSSLRCFVNGIALIFFLFLLAFLSERMKIVVKEIGRHYYSADWNCWLMNMNCTWAHNRWLVLTEISQTKIFVLFNCFLCHSFFLINFLLFFSFTPPLTGSSFVYVFEFARLLKDFFCVFLIIFSSKMSSHNAIVGK